MMHLGIRFLWVLLILVTFQFQSALGFMDGGMSESSGKCCPKIQRPRDIEYLLNNIHSEEELPADKLAVLASLYRRGEFVLKRL